MGRGQYGDCVMTTPISADADWQAHLAVLRNVYELLDSPVDAALRLLSLLPWYDAGPTTWRPEGGLWGAPTHSALLPAGPQATHIHDLWQFTLWLCMGVFALILLALIVAVVRAGRRTRRVGGSGDPAAMVLDHGPRRWVTAATVGSAVLLAVVLGADMLTDRALSRLPAADAIRIEMTAQQWWWEARYLGSGGKPDFAVAGELHVPVGKPVIVTLKSADVIHTFWVPSLHGKKDMLPGRSTQIVLQADTPGTYRGECAEFCGLQHALMAFSVTAQPPQAYADWHAFQTAAAAPPSGADAVRGQQIFLASNCAQCHTVRGTAAAGLLGPDLTHVGSRGLLAAGTVPNEPAKLAAWIVDPQSLKAGSTMPSSRLAPEEVRALVAYLGQLR